LRTPIVGAIIHGGRRFAALARPRFGPESGSGNRERAKKRGSSPEQVYDEYVWEMALRRATCAQDVAGTVCFLVSDESKNITGQSITVDGGWDVSPPRLRRSGRCDLFSIE